MFWISMDLLSRFFYSSFPTALNYLNFNWDWSIYMVTLLFYLFYLLNCSIYLTLWYLCFVCSTALLACNLNELLVGFFLSVFYLPYSFVCRCVIRIQSLESLEFKVLNRLTEQDKRNFTWNLYWISPLDFGWNSSLHPPSLVHPSGSCQFDAKLQKVNLLAPRQSAWARITS